MSVPDQYRALGETSGHIARIIKDGWARGHRSRQRAAGRLHPAPL